MSNSRTEATSDERKAFEAWALEKHYAYRDKNGIWFYDFSEPLWRGWQGGRASPQRVLHSISSVDIEKMIAACVPGGASSDPQFVADEIRRYLDAWPESEAAPPKPFQQRVDRPLPDPARATGVLAAAGDGAAGVEPRLVEGRGVSLPWKRTQFAYPTPAELQRDLVVVLRDNIVKQLSSAEAQFSTCNFGSTPMWWAFAEDLLP